jgi:hypothetical protein
LSPSKPGFLWCDRSHESGFGERRSKGGVFSAVGGLM